MPERLRNLLVNRVAFVPKGDNPGAEVLLWKAHPGTIAKQPDSADVHVDGPTPCPNCKKMVPAGRAKCPNCGTTMDNADMAKEILPGQNVSDTKCASCGTPNPKGLKQCKTCGKVIGDNADLAKSAQQYEQLIKRSFTAEQRRALAAKGQAMPDGSYPIENADDIHNAVMAMGRGNAASSTIKAHIIRVAQKLGLTSALPPDWVGKIQKNPRMTPSRLTRLRDAMAQLGTIIEETEGRKEDTVTEAAKTLPDDLPEEVVKAFEELVSKVDELEARLVEKDEKVDEGIDPIEKALQNPDIDPVMKLALESAKQAKADGEVAKAEAAALRAEKEEAEAVAKAAQWKHLSQKPETFGPMLAKLRKEDPEVAEEVERVLTSANAVANESMREIGRPAAGEASDAFEKLQKMAEEYAKTNEISEAEAFVKVIETKEGKALHNEYREEVASE